MNRILVFIKKQPQIILFIISFALYANTLNHGYVLDDAIVITENTFVKQGIEGVGSIFSTESFTGFFGFDKQLVAGGRYRPLSIAFFAIEYELFGNQPFIGHLINVLLYGFLVVLLFQILFKSGRVTLLTAFGIALLFALHPIHTEVVANIKGRDEILSFLFVLISIYFFLFFRKSSLFGYALGAVSLFLALLSKEHAIAFVILTPMAMYYLRYENSKIWKVLPFVVLPAIAFVWIRFLVLGGMQIEESTSLMNNPFVAMDFSERYGTVLYTWFRYAALLVLPHPLTYDYYPYHIPIVDFSNAIPWIVLAIVLIALVFAFKSLFKRQIYGYWIWFFIGTFVLMSNLFFSIGTFMNERFMFISSLSFVVGITLLLRYMATHGKFAKAGLVISILLSLGYVAKSVDRNRDWKDDFTLFTHDVSISEGSAKGNCLAGGKWHEKAVITTDKQQKQADLLKARAFLRKALNIYPTYNDALLLYGNTLVGLNMGLDSVIPYYKSILSRAPQHANAWKNALLVLQNGESKTRLAWYKELEQINRKNFDILYNMGVIYGRDLKMYDESEFYLNKALEQKPENVKALKDLAVVYGMTHKYSESVDVLIKVVEKQPSDAGSWYNLGVSYFSLKEVELAQKAFDKSYSLDSTRSRIVVRR